MRPFCDLAVVACGTRRPGGAFLRKLSVAVLCVVGFTRPAAANPELFATYDSRSVGLGGTGVAFQTNAAAPVHNAALLAGIDKLSITATFTPYALQLNSPFVAPTGQRRQIASDWALGPLGQLGVAVRVHRRVVIGASAFLPLGLASNYQNAPFTALAPYTGSLSSVPPAVLRSLATTSGELKPFLAMGELIIPVSIELTDWLSLAGGYRMTYANQSLKASVRGSELMQLSMDAYNFGGYDIGAWVHPNAMIKAGVSFRSKVVQDYKANLKLNLPTGVQTLALTNPLGQFSAPHLVKGGVALTPLTDKLMVTGEFRYFFYHDADAALDNAFVINAGIELHPVSLLALRVGGAYGTQATPRGLASAFAPPPGASWIVTAGAGVKVPSVDIDLAVGYGQEGSGTTSAPPATAGTYHDRAIVASVSANVHM